MPRDKNIFTLNPTSLDMKRSVFPRNCQVKTSFNLGQIIPLYFDEILPGDTVTMDLAQVIRMSTPIAPIMDNIYADVYAFFVPNRLVWNHWQQFCGENDTTAWTQTTQYSIPKADVGQTGTPLGIGCVGDYLGLPVNNRRSGTGILPNHCYVSELPLRMYTKIYNDWFRDENSIAPTLFTIGDTANTSITYSMNPFKASRFHDLFSSCLPAPQKGGSVLLPLGEYADVYVSGTSDAIVPAADGKGDLRVVSTSTTDAVNNSNKFTYLSDVSGSDARYDAKLVADLSHATAATINQLRTAFQVQKLLEKDARGGTRYIELLRAHFGVTSPDARLQRSEYLAGHRFRINVDQVVATADSGASGSSVVGQTGAVSKTTQAGSLFTKSFVEHGCLMILCVLRQDHTYSQGLEKYWLKSDRFDFYYPVLANIGEVPVYKSELNVAAGLTIEPGKPSGVFGYNEAWYEYRFKPSRATGYMNPVINNSLNYWTIGDVFNGAQSLNANFLEESPLFLDRALQVPSSTMHQFIGDFYFKANFSRVMPVYSIPGLIDHH